MLAGDFLFWKMANKSVFFFGFYSQQILNLAKLSHGWLPLQQCKKKLK